MKEKEPKRRLLIVDDQTEIHDTFNRIFSGERRQDEALSDFESRFLGTEEGLALSGHTSVTKNYQLQHARTGEEAAQIVRQAVKIGTPFAVAFVDMRMPNNLDGMETTELLWEIDPQLHVVICTAYSDHIWEEVLKRLGYNDRLLLLKKPFESDEARQLALALSEKSRLAKIQHEKVKELGNEIDRRRRAEEAMREMAHRDALTKLPNRPYLIEKLTRLVQKTSPESRNHHAVLFLDLDDFKTINDSLGHDAGDVLLNQVAGRLKECVRHRDISGRVPKESETVRLGGDEFVVLLEKLDKPRDALLIADRIVSRLSEPFDLRERLVTVGTSVGIAFLSSNTKDAHEILRNADTAMYRAKNLGKGQVAVFDQTMHEDLLARLELENQLRTAVTQEKFALHYQPIVNLQQGRIQGAEVLIRWTLDEGEIISPSQFIPMIEEIGLISRVGEWVLEQSMHEVLGLSHEISTRCQDDFYFAVNVSRRQLNDPFFFESLESILDRTGFDRRRLKLEMNESSSTRGEDQALQTMLDLHRSGVGIQIDDFGKGQSSLTCFQDYPIEAVKIDRSFTASIAKDNSHSVIAQAIVQLAHHLNAKIIAEGVESETQLEWLLRSGCDAAQGFLFSPPICGRALRDLIKNPLKSKGIRMCQIKRQGGITFDLGPAKDSISPIS